MSIENTTAPNDPGPEGVSVNPAFDAVMRGGMVRLLGIHITSIRPDEVIAEMRIASGHLNHNGNVNGGALMAFADILGAAGAAVNRRPGYRGGTLESKTNFFAAAKGDVIYAVSIPLHQGRSTAVWQTTMKDSNGKLVAMVTQTQMILPERAE